MQKLSLVLTILAGCWTSSAPTPTSNQPTAPDVSVQLAAVTLGDDCGDSPALPMPMSAPKRRAPSQGAPSAPMPADCGPGGCGGSYRGHCEQTSMQIRLRASDGAGSTNVRVKKVELLDKSGKRLAELESRAPAKWAGSSYVAWNQRIAGGETLSATYALSSPDWDALTGGRWNAHSKTFQLRVTLAIGERDRTVEKQSITPAMIEPPVPT